MREPALALLCCAGMACCVPAGSAAQLQEVCGNPIKQPVRICAWQRLPAHAWTVPARART